MTDLEFFQIFVYLNLAYQPGIAFWDLTLSNFSSQQDFSNIFKMDQALFFQNIFLGSIKVLKQSEMIEHCLKPGKVGAKWLIFF